MKFAIIISVILFIIGVLLGILQLWFVPFDADLFVKIEMTLAALFTIVVVVSFVYKEYLENKTTRDGNQL